MEEHKNFTITLHLTHFFQDHRSMCKLFVNERMKRIADLHEHVQQIFNLKNFYFLSNGFYIPLTEDIRILQPHDILVAIPNQKTNLPVYTSTPIVKNIDIPPISGKRKKETLVEDDFDLRHLNSNVEHLASPKNKKKKQKHLTVVRENSQKDSDLENITNITPKPYKKSKKIKHLDISNLENKSLTDQISKKTDVKKESNKTKARHNKESETTPENTSNNSVKNKVLYFEIHSNSTKSKGNECEITPTMDKDQIVENGQDNHSELTNSGEKKENPLNWKRTPLFIHKRSNNTISYELPKKSNIVESIVVVNKSSDQANSTINLPIKKHKKTSPNIRDSIKNLVEAKYKSFHPTLENNLTSNRKTDNENRDCKLDNTLPLPSNQIGIDNKDKHTKPILKDKIIASCSAITNQEPEPILIRAENISKCEKVQIIQENSNSSNRQLEPMDCSSSTLNKNAEMNQEHNLSQLASINDVSSNSLTESSVLKDVESDVSMLSNNIQSADVTGFVTRRKRIRSHRKRKSKVSAENKLIPVPTECYPKKSPVFPAPTMHIKFTDDDDDPVNPANTRDVKEVNTIENQINNVVGSENCTNDDSMIKEVNGHAKTRRQSKNFSLSSSKDSNCITVGDETLEEIGKFLSPITPLISEDTILKSPLMTSTIPKCRDIIAFKILKLTETYTPEISKYIIGEIQSVNEDNSNIDINIIDGLDECKEPDGKFSIESGEDDPDNIKSYSWSSLIEPRLIFP